jgi:GNAT superfamily N-acetyltransferase
VLRRATIDDSAAAAHLLAIVNPEWVSSVEGIRHHWTSSPPEARRAAWCVEDGHEMIGWAICALMVETSEPGVGWIGVNVHPERRRTGLGSALLAAAEHHATEIGVARLLSFSRGDEPSASFARSRAYEQTASNEILVVDPRAVEPPVLPEGVELRPYTGFADDPSPIYKVDAASSVDMPGEARFDAISYPYWLERFWRHPSIDRDASMVALVEGKAASTTMLYTDRASGRGQNNGTGTLREFRGRGLATAAKQASLARAAEVGCTAVYAGNDATNAPMLAINRKLGYRPCTTELSWGKTLAPTSGP